jgi:hypothetical protein
MEDFRWIFTNQNKLTYLRGLQFEAYTKFEEDNFTTKELTSQSRKIIGWPNK